MSDRLDLPVLSYDAGNRPDFGAVRIEASRQRGGGLLWAVRCGLNAMGVDGEWEWEPSPSNRDDVWLARHRFASAVEAYAALCRSRGDTPPAPADDDLLSDRVAAAGVRQLLAGELTGPPLPGTLAESVDQWADDVAEDAVWRGFR